MVLGIVADDLTGAMDSAGPLAVRGLSAVVVLDPDGEPSGTDWDVVSYTTQSRDLEDEETAQVLVRNATRRLISRGYTRLFKKVDSTLRGHNGLEIEAAMEEAGTNCAFVAPAFPVMGRTLVGGVLHVDGRTLVEPGRAKGPSVVSLLERQAARKVGLVELSTVEAGERAIARRVGELLRLDRSIIVFDAATQGQLEEIEATLHRHRPHGLLVGSAGLASAIAEGLGPPKTNVATPPSISGRVIVIAGSVNQATLSQLDRLQRLPSMCMIGIDHAAASAAKSEAAGEMARVRESAQQALLSGFDVALRWSEPRNVAGPGLAIEPRWEQTRRLASFLRSLASKLVGAAQPEGLVLTGGETAYAVLTGLEADGIEVGSELEPGVPWGRVQGGLADSLAVATKAGGFGGEEALADAVMHLRGETVNRLGCEAVQDGDRC